MSIESVVLGLALLAFAAAVAWYVTRWPATDEPRDWQYRDEHDWDKWIGRFK